MTDSPQAARYEAVEVFQPDELVVDLADLDVVMKQLDDLGLNPQETRRNTRLRLARVQLSDLSGLRAKPSMQAAIVQAKESRKGTILADEEVALLDALLVKLRDGDGPIPTLGKNRLLGGVEGSPHVGGGVGAPRVLDGGFELPERPKGPRVRVGLLDTRLFPHPALAGRYLVADRGVLFERPSDGADPLSTAGHAVFLAGVIQQANPCVDLVVKQVLDDQAVAADSWAVAEKMVDFLEEDIKILNLSFGCVTVDRRAPLVLQRAVEQLGGILIVAAAGNHGERPGRFAGLPVWPAALPQVVAVGAEDGGGQPTAFSPNEDWVDVQALGEDVESAFLMDDVTIVERNAAGEMVLSEKPVTFTGKAGWDGTSFSAAHATAKFADLLAWGQNPTDLLGKLLSGDAALLSRLGNEGVHRFRKRPDDA
jgi:hypothetical protein